MVMVYGDECVYCMVGPLPPNSQWIVILGDSHRRTTLDDSKMSASWLVNHPPVFQKHVHNGVMVDARNNTDMMALFEAERQYYLTRPDVVTDGEVVDALDHFFWGMTNGTAMELGGLDGSRGTNSMTASFEEKFNWKRILIEGNPSYREDMMKNSPLAFSVNAAICSNPSTLHYCSKLYVGGLLEFMSQDFLATFHGEIFTKCTPHGNLSSIDLLSLDNVKAVECIPLTHVLWKAHVHHINYFVLDVEGGEYEVLKSINFNKIAFDVFCIETDRGNRPAGYEALITGFMKEKGYLAHTEQKGRNIWFIRDGFIPSVRPGAVPDCYFGALQGKPCIISPK